MIKILSSTLLLILTPACTTATKTNSNESPLNGRWQLAYAKCTANHISKSVKKYNNDVKVGRIKYEVTLRGNDANVTYFQLDQKSGATCETLIQETWVPNAAGTTVTISKTRAESIAKGHEQNEQWCPRTYAVDKERTHIFQIKGDELMLTIWEGTSPTGKKPRPLCERGQDVYVFTRQK